MKKVFLVQDEFLQGIASIRDSIFKIVEDGALAALLATSSLSRNIRRWRQQTSCALPIPSARFGFDIPLEYSKLESGDTFLQYDSGVEDEERILIFASSTGLDDLVKYSNWAGDGTFKVCPSIYYQLYTIHIQIGQFSVPRVFALLPDKKEATYDRLFSPLNTLRPEIHPELYMIDFEKAAINSLTSKFPDLNVCSCLFHCSQNLYRKIVELGFKVQYNTDEEFCLKIKCFTALAFLPVADVIDAYEELADDDSLPQEFVSYFEVTYIGPKRGRGSRRHRLSPLFSIDVWNVSERILAGMTRTNNSLEGCHNAIQNSIACHHPNIWKLISALKLEAILAQKKIDFDRE
ncbi:uncharacterized protein [Palaemon carinicauda]|uniref:uncharacterized protein n=1 Tax=Palaemon carinicauda TaxID=392227 RepID=UPI0035B6A925